MDIPESYASPGQRLGLFRADHPNAPQPEFTLVRGADVPKAGIPKKFGGDAEFCMCTLAYGPEEGIEPVIGYKECSDARKSDAASWRVLCVKAMGRALKDAGYPADLFELEDVQKWRARNAKVAAILAGTDDTPTPAPAPVEGQRTPAEIEPEDHADVDEAPAQETPSEDPTPEPEPEPQPEVQAEKVEQPVLEPVANPEPEASDEIDRDAIRGELNSLDEEEKAAFRAFMGEIGLTGKADTWSDDQLREVERWLTT
jgi:hypothetical protein